ncbi:MAG: putative Adenosine deaminase [Puniceicoccaceae bacterium 5H]|nr:MAG: putative Adenosine deaminase [Puniceicoccaceae bacterium 5H]
MDAAQPVLLASVGASPVVLIEALFRMADGPRPAALYCFTLSGQVNGLDEVRQYVEQQLEIPFYQTRLEGLQDVRSAADHAGYTEALMRWYLELQHTVAAPLWVCMSGGRKTMTAALQQAAETFGAADLYHVLVREGEEPREPAAAHQAALDGRLDFVTLGPRAARPMVAALRPNDFPLDIISTEPPARTVSVSDRALSDYLRQRAEATDALWQQRESLADRAFPALLLANASQQRWLEAPLDPSADAAWIAALPKVELHCHLGGFATHGPELERVRAAATSPHLPGVTASVPLPPEGWPRPHQPCPLDTYMRLGDANGSSLLSDAGCLRAQIEGLYAHFVATKVRYAEVRCSPNNYARDRDAWSVLQDIQSTFERCMAQSDPRERCQVNLIIIVSRRQSGDLSSISRHVALAVTAGQRTYASECCNVVGLDLAGFENKETRPLYFQHDFDAAHRCGLAVTAHAGENDDVESIWQAVYRLSARRIGHALHLTQSRDLMRAFAERGIGVEMCPYANYQIKGFRPMPGQTDDYPLLRYLQAGIKVTVNTDNIGISAASLNDNLLFLAKLCPDITRSQIIQLQRNALDTAFAPFDERHRLRIAFNRELERQLAAV